MATPAIQTLLTDAQQVLNLNSLSEVRATMAAALANANVGTPLNPNLTTQQLWDEFYLIVRQPESDIESIITNQLMKFLFAPPAPGGVGANGQVIFNDGGVLAGDPQFLWNKTTNLLTVTGSATITGDLTVRTNQLVVNSSGSFVGKSAGAVGTDGVQLLASGFSGFSASGTTALFLNRNTSDGTVLQLGRSGASAVDLGAIAGGGFTVGLSGSEWMRIDSTGLGVGGSPTEKLTVFGASTVYGDARFNVGLFDPTSATTGTGSGISFAGYTNGVTVGATFAQIKGIKENSTAGNIAGALVISTLPNGGTPVERLRIDSVGNCGIGVTPNSAWNVGSGKTIQLTANASLSGGLTNSTYLAQNWYYDNANSRYLVPGYCLVYEQNKSNGSHVFYNTTLGAASGDIATLIPAMTLDINGNLILRSSATPATLGTNGQLTVNATSNTNLRFSYRGSDGTTRVANITLA